AYLLTEHHLVAAIVEGRNEPEFTVLDDPRLESPACPTRTTAPAVGRRNRPARERARDLDHIFLRIAAIDAKRVQLEQLPAVVLVETTAASVAGLLVRSS